MTFRVLRPLSLALLAATATTAVACLPDTPTTAPSRTPVVPAAPGGGGAAAVPTTTTSTAPAGPKKLAIVGDSITYLSTPELSAGFGLLGWDVQIRAKTGDMFRERMAGAAELAAMNPDIAIVNLGTNDSVCVLFNALTSTPCRFPTFTTGDMFRDADTMRNLFSATTCFIGVSPSFSADTGEHWKQLAANGVIAGVADWASVTQKHPEYLFDGIGHLTAVGNVAYAKFLNAEQQRICGGHA